MVRFIEEAGATQRTVWGQLWCPISTHPAMTLSSSGQEIGPASRQLAPLVHSMSLPHPASFVCVPSCAPASAVATGSRQLQGPHGCYGKEMHATEQWIRESSSVISSQAWDGLGISSN